MSYLGQVELKSSEIRRVDVTGSTSATHTLTWTPPSEQSLIITINGIKQQNNYSISGVTLTLDDALLSDDKMEVIGILDIGEATIPPDDSITTAMVKDDAIDADKLANSINTEIAANTAKVTNATHTGDVTGATALTIAADAVDIAMLSATGTASASTFLRGDNAWASAGGLSDASMWVLTTSLTGISDVDITTNLAVYSGDGYGSLGSAMTESSGIFTFPSTGYWQITFRSTIQKGGTDTYSSSVAIYTTLNDSAYGLAAKTRAGNYGTGANQYAAPASTFLFDVTDVANCKVKFHIEDANTSDTFIGSTTYIATGFEFMRLGDT